MNFRRKKVISAALLIVLITFGSLGSQAFAKKGEKRNQGPPPEAYTACEGKSEGDEAQFSDPRGEIVKGTCEKRDDRLVLRPDRPRRCLVFKP